MERKGLDILKQRNGLDPRTALYFVGLVGGSAFFMNKPLTGHLLCALAALFLIGCKAYKHCVCYLAFYAIIALIMACIEHVPNTTLMLMIISLSYIVQKFVILLMMGSFLVKTTPLPYLLAAMQTMRVPDMILIPFMVAMRFFPTIRADHRCLKESLRIRRVSVSPVQFVLHPLRTSEYLIVPILLRSTKTADELSASAMVRGIERSRQRTILYPLHFGSLDAITALLTTLVIAALFWLQFD